MINSSKFSLLNDQFSKFTTYQLNKNLLQGLPFMYLVNEYIHEYFPGYILMDIFLLYNQIPSVLRLIFQFIVTVSKLFF